MCAEHDILLAITTSGNSKNILEVLKEARNRDIYTLGFLGNGGGEAWLIVIRLLWFLVKLLQEYKRVISLQAMPYCSM